MSSKTWIIFAVACVALLGGLVLLSDRDELDVSQVDVNNIQAASEQSGNIGDHVKGNPDSEVILIEYIDFQCQGCAGAFPRVKTIANEYNDEIAIVVRNFPITQNHPNARIAAAAAEAAGLQDKYWEMHDVIFENQPIWKDVSADERTEVFLNYARQIELDIDQFQEDIGSEKVTKKISFDKALAAEHDVNSTPTFYLNGEQLESEIWGDDEAFRRAIDTALEEKGIKRQPATPTEDAT